MTTPSDIHDLIGAYVLDAVCADEHVAFEQHLTDCSECRAEVDELRMVALELATAVPPQPPTQAMTDRVFADIRKHRQPTADAALGRTQLLPAMPAQDALCSTAIMPSLDLIVDNGIRPQRESHRWSTRVAVGVTVAAVAAVLTGATVLVGQRSEAGASVTVEQVRTARDVITRDGMVFAGSGSARAVLSHSAGKVVISASDLPALDDEHGYQLWVLSADGTPQSAGMMHTSGQQIELAADLPDDAELITITTEPSDGSTQPTTPIVVRVDLN